MNPRTKVWLVGSLFAQATSVYGFIADDTWFIGLAVLVFLALAVERWDNLARTRRRGGQR